MQHKRSLFVIIATLALVISIFFISGSLSAPEPNQNSSEYTDGQTVELSGEMVCLQHTDQDGPQTLECAYGFKDESGNYYALHDTSSDYSLISSAPMNEKVQIKGVFRESQDDKYIQNGSIELTSVEQ